MCGFSFFSPERASNKNRLPKSALSNFLDWNNWKIIFCQWFSLMYWDFRKILFFEAIHHNRQDKPCWSKLCVFSGNLAAKERCGLMASFENKDKQFDDHFCDHTNNWKFVYLCRIKANFEFLVAKLCFICGKITRSEFFCCSIRLSNLILIRPKGRTKRITLLVRFFYDHDDHHHDDDDDDHQNQSQAFVLLRLLFACQSTFFLV